MQIGIDAREIQDGVYTGIGRALYNFLRCFEEMTGDDACVLFSARPLPLSFSSRIRKRVSGFCPVFLWDQVVLPRLVLDERIDLFYSPYYKLPLFLSCRKVCAVLDLMYLVFPSYRERLGFFGRMYHAVFARAYMHAADKVLTCSQYSCADIARIYGLNRKKVAAIPLSVGFDFYPEKDVLGLERVRLRHGILGRYLLYAGNFKPHKNVEFLCGVLRELLLKYPDIQLVLAGQNGCDADRVMACAKREGVDAKVIITGTLVDAGILRALYSGAEVFVMPSLYEGFGIPPLEAMACGCPVVCSNLTALPESAGDAALLVDPLDQSGFVQAVDSFLSDPVLRARHIQRGLIRVKDFSARCIADRMMAFFKEVVGENDGAFLYC